MGQVGGAVSICGDKIRGNILQGGHGSGFGSELVQEVVKSPDKNFITFCGEVEFINPVQSLII